MSLHPVTHRTHELPWPWQVSIALATDCWALLILCESLFAVYRTSQHLQQPKWSESPGSDVFVDIQIL